jgi:hypothetical protein
VKPAWPLWANTADQEPVPVANSATKEYAKLPEETATFLEAATAFMRRWQLAGLSTWDLPLPQGPLEALPLEAARHFCGPQQSESVFPGYYDIPSTRDLRRERRQVQAQQAEAADLGLEFPLTDISARADDSSKWENVFRFWLIESTALRRYAGRSRLVTRLIEAFAGIAECGLDRIKQIRRVYGHILNTSSSD